MGHRYIPLFCGSGWFQRSKADDLHKSYVARPVGNLVLKGRKSPTKAGGKGREVTGDRRPGNHGNFIGNLMDFDGQIDFDGKHGGEISTNGDFSWISAGIYWEVMVGKDTIGTTI